MKHGILILFVLTLIFTSCNNKEPKQEMLTNNEVEAPFEQLMLPDTKAGAIVLKAIEQAGGWKQWKQKKTLSYVKRIQYYDSLGNKEKELEQVHQYQLQPTFKAKMSWIENGDLYEILNNGVEAWKLKNGVVLTNEDDKKSAWNSSFGSHYVMCMPFKLADKGTILEYEGIDTLANNQIVHAVKATYEKGAGSSGGLHTWWYYFDKDTYTPAANFLDYGDGYSYTAYVSFIDVDGLKINKQRDGYNTSANRELLDKRTEYINENILFDEVLDEGVFTAKQRTE